MQLAEVEGKSPESQSSSLPSTSHGNLNSCFIYFYIPQNSLFLVFSSIDSEKHTESCNHHQNYDAEPIRHPREYPVLPLCSQPLLPPLTLETSALVSAL